MVVEVVDTSRQRRSHAGDPKEGPLQGPHNAGDTTSLKPLLSKEKLSTISKREALYQSRHMGKKEQRKQKNIDDAKSAQAAAERLEKNKTVNKFISNVESRIYANLSKQLVDNMFGTSCDSSTTTCPTSGTANIEGAQIYWVKDTSTDIITLTVTADDGTVTTITVPVGDFVF